MKVNGNIWGTDMAATVAQGAGRERLAQLRDGVKRGARRTWALAIGGAVMALALFILVSLASYRPGDPSLNTAANGPARNWLGGVVADLHHLVRPIDMDHARDE